MMTTDMKMSETNAVTFGRYLRSIRLNKHIRIEEVSRKTKIRIETLNAIEQEDFTNLPAEVYVKGFIRAYAKFIGADGGLAVELYAGSLKIFQEAAKSEADIQRYSKKFWPHLALSLALFTGIVAATVTVTQVLRQTDPGEHYQASRKDEELKPPAQASVQAPGKDADAAAETRPEVIEEPMLSLVPEKTEPVPVLDIESETTIESDTAEAVMDETQKGPNYRLLINATEETWLKIIIDATIQKEFLLKPGENAELEADSGFNVLIGNAGGVHMMLNGELVYSEGLSGQVVNLELP